MSTTNLAAQTLQRQISDGTWQPGNKLPGQRGLAESMGISRATLREALSMLEALGFVRSLPGRGTLVTRGPAGSVPDTSRLATKDAAEHAALTSALPTALAPTHSQALQQLWQFRFCIESASAALAARNMRLDQASRLWDVQARMEEEARVHGMAGTGASDLEFHRFIAVLSGNAHLQEVLSSFDSEIGRAVAVPVADAGRIDDVLREHRAIAAAICAGDAQGAREAMQQHLRNAARSLGFEFTDP
jgi:GntR family transcriptional repressor for pyruvate dehydrogenase complex